MTGILSGWKAWIGAGALLLSAAAVPAVAAHSGKLTHRHHKPALLSALTVSHKATRSAKAHKALKMHVKHHHAHNLHHKTQAPKAM